MSDLPTLPKTKLIHGARGPDVALLQSLLASQGFYRVRIDGDFGPKTRDAVHSFQTTHVGPDHEFLKATGQVDKATWWALHNPSGSPQRSNLFSRIPAGLNKERQLFLQAWSDEHQKGVKEDPDGSNWGGGVERYLKGVGPAPWCCYAFSEIFKDSQGRYPFGERLGLVAKFWAMAKREGIDFDASTTPIPGDAGIYLYRNASGRLTGTGHIFVIASVSPDGKRFNTFGGNEGNRIKYGVRSAREPSLVGFARLLPVPAGHVQRMLVDAGGVQQGPAATR